MIDLAVDVVATGKLPKCALHTEISEEAPSWASKPVWQVALCPIDGGAEIDLSGDAVLKVGRSLSSCIQLPEITVSRKHAVILHHACGDTYVVDDGSAHGTYVNNVMLKANIPHKLRRGSLIKFGGESAPVFLFKAFEKIERLLEDIDDLCETDDEGSSSLPTEDVKVVCGDSGVVCVSCNNRGSISKQEASLASQTLVNTLLNAGGGGVGGAFHSGDRVPSSSVDKSSKARGDVDVDEKKKKNNNKRRGITVCADGESSESLVEMVADHVSTQGKKKKQCLASNNSKSVKFSPDPPKMYAPPCITPEESSESSEDGSLDGSDSSLDGNSEVPAPPVAGNEDDPTPPPSPPQLPQGSDSGSVG